MAHGAGGGRLGDLALGQGPGQGAPRSSPSGSASALEAEAGFDFRLVDPISLRILGEYSSTKYSLSPASGAPYQASSAEDRRLGARATLRGTF